jgi:hypothetical protein
LDGTSATELPIDSRPIWNAFIHISPIGIKPGARALAVSPDGSAVAAMTADETIAIDNAMRTMSDLYVAKGLR